MASARQLSPSTTAANDLYKSKACDQCRLKKIRCGKERPNCSNCERMNLDCNWSGQGKKPNQTVALNKSISTMGDRLRLIEGNISGIQQSLQRLDSAVRSRPGLIGLEDMISVPPVGTGSPPGAGSNQGGCGTSSSSASDISTVKFDVIHDAQGNERCVGPTSLLSLIHNIDELSMPDPEGTGNNNATVREKIKELGYNTRQPLFPNTNDGSMIKEPPMLIVESLMDHYFDIINPHFPIWTRDGFRRLMDVSRQESNPASNKPFVVCANNMVLLTLMAKALHSRAKSSSGSNLDLTIESIDVELVQSFIENANRAMVRVEQLLSPRLVNVQALLSLCYVSQMCLCEDVSSLTLTLAAHVAKLMGLYQTQTSSLSPSKFSPEDILERQNVLKCLYYLDKAICWNVGSPPSAPFDAILTTTAMTRLPGEGPSLMDAKFILAQIEDDIYRLLYLNTTGQISMTTKAIRAKLENWRVTCHLDAEDSEEAGYQFPFSSRLELDILFHYARMRLMWPSVGEPDAKTSLIQDCQTSLLLLQQLWNNTSKHVQHHSFAWLVASFPANAVFQFASQFANSETLQSAAASLELLSFLLTSLQNMSTFATKNSYVVRFCSFVQILVHLAHNILNSKASGSPEQSTLPNLYSLDGRTQDHHGNGPMYRYDGEDGGAGLDAFMQEKSFLHQDLDTFMAMWGSGANSFATLSRDNDVITLDGIPASEERGLWDDFNLADNLNHMRDCEMEPPYSGD
ncbi:hypothetical protein LY78DRAFT_750130 [Colletotrichum sublineola]|nr:hypothetical protein LY78DRAFT_750130 [Colletotrichum sublineola]